MAFGSSYPQRIVCLTEETTEALYLMGEQRRIVGISGFTVRPPQARKEKPKVSAFTSAKIDKILALQPDLVLGFSDLQADIGAELTRAGIEVHLFNQRSVTEILRMIRVLAGMIGETGKGDHLVSNLQKNIELISIKSKELNSKPKVFFEEWDEPLISAIRWVSELIGIAGGEDIFPELAEQPLGRNRILTDPDEVIRRQPDVIIGSWCGKKFRPEKVAARPGWQALPAVRNQELHEIKSALILQPGPAALSDGLNALATIVQRWAQRHR
ncbi:MAG TPA: cobalamin-binding protein [Gammaproteobacteria bacterium]|nr:cobalamin-binding protein [Gammaproteobacteria bacterium]